MSCVTALPGLGRHRNHPPLVSLALHSHTHAHTRARTHKHTRTAPVQAVAKERPVTNEAEGSLPPRLPLSSPCGGLRAGPSPSAPPACAPLPPPRALQGEEGGREGQEPLPRESLPEEVPQGVAREAALAWSLGGKPGPSGEAQPAGGGEGCRVHRPRPGAGRREPGAFLSPTCCVWGGALGVRTPGPFPLGASHSRAKRPAGLLPASSGHQGQSRLGG